MTVGRVHYCFSMYAGHRQKQNLIGMTNFYNLEGINVRIYDKEIRKHTLYHSKKYFKPFKVLDISFEYMTI